MKISRSFPQFEEGPVLFVVSGSYESRFLLANKGEILEVDKLALNPREEAKEKQGFITSSHGKNLGAVSHRDRYLLDLEKRILRLIGDRVGQIVKLNKVAGICLIAPSYFAKKIKLAIGKPLEKLVSTTIFGEYPKKNALGILELYQKATKESLEYVLYTPRAYDLAKRSRFGTAKA